LVSGYEYEDIIVFEVVARYKGVESFKIIKEKI
jgi:hypothetical protein